MLATKAEAHAEILRIWLYSRLYTQYHKQNKTYNAKVKTHLSVFSAEFEAKAIANDDTSLIFP